MSINYWGHKMKGQEKKTDVPFLSYEHVYAPRYARSEPYIMFECCVDICFCNRIDK